MIERIAKQIEHGESDDMERTAKALGQDGPESK
jgi:hypothetical protein